MSVRIACTAAVKQGQDQAFWSEVQALTTMVREEERGAALAYEYYSNPEKPAEICIHEVYVDWDGLMNHSKLVRGRMPNFHALFDVLRIDMCGNEPPPEGVVERFRERYGDRVMFYLAAASA